MDKQIKLTIILFILSLQYIPVGIAENTGLLPENYIAEFTGDDNILKIKSLKYTTPKNIEYVNPLFFISVDVVVLDIELYEGEEMPTLSKNVIHKVIFTFNWNDLYYHNNESFDYFVIEQIVLEDNSASFFYQDTTNDTKISGEYIAHLKEIDNPRHVLPTWLQWILAFMLFFIMINMFTNFSNQLFKPKTQINIPEIIMKKTKSYDDLANCCKLSYRLKDGYCGVCGLVVPLEVENSW
ncbi:hypothetical protein LCGC14_0176520 [marine sediment metagenome]|uniref:Uncharacterized protein n=1 Tax=marine sediment metagenome TaxID=412755 RepID=A0A0F9XU14_9ZZZZ